VTFFSLGFAVLTAGGIVAFYNIEKDRKTKALAKNVKSVGKPALGGPWVLVDQDGIPRTDASYRGNFAILYFGFTYCPDICPSELVKVGNIIKLLGKYYQLCRILKFPLQTLGHFALASSSSEQKRRRLKA
jgi:protein SCO1/2